VYGPRQDPQSTYAAVIPRFIKAALTAATATIYGDGTQSRDFTFVEDCVAANLLACRISEHPGEVCNIGSGSRVSITELHRMIQTLSGGQQTPEYAPPRTGDVKHSLADIGKARSLLGYVPRHDLKSGLARTLEWFSTTSGSQA
jgi:nucleoside-diphosphate-sugar epimerase